MTQKARPGDPEGLSVYKIVENRIRKDNYLATIVEYSDQVFWG